MTLRFEISSATIINYLDYYDYYHDSGMMKE